MVLFTPDARIAAGGAEAITAEIELAVSEANMVFENSEADARIHLVHSQEVIYTESRSLWFDLLRLKEPNDGFLDEAAQSSPHFAEAPYELCLRQFDLP